MKLENLDYVVLVVKDLDRSLAFYTGWLGIRLQYRTPTYAQLQAGSTRLALYTRAAMQEMLGSPLEKAPESATSFELAFKVSDVDAAFAELIALGATPTREPTTRPWGQRSAHFRDPDGHLVELIQDLAVPPPGGGHGPGAPS